MQFFWINKQNSYQLKNGETLKISNGMLGNYFWAPMKGKGGRSQNHWERLGEMAVGDVAFISVKRKLTAVAKVLKTPSIRPALHDFKQWSGEGYYVEVSYKPLSNELSIDDFFDDIKELLPDKYGPFTHEGKRNEGYCFALNDAAGSFLLNLTDISFASGEFTGLGDNAQQNFESDYQPRSEEDARKIVLAAIRQRQGQPKFRNGLLEIYEGKCAITASKASVVLEAAHIAPYNGEETNELSNGILLRSDIHTLFDRGLVRISAKDYSISVDSTLRDSEYWRFNGLRIRLPIKEAPSRSALKHKENLN
ncbi:MAG: hypothetical protein GW778_01515 [Alphaproteobacteria bacterium]|nr:hypothetical protein [Alphaproteobacteria bacterium]